MAAAVHADLARIAGIAGAPAFSRVARWAEAMPRYTIGHLGRVAALDEAMRALAGLLDARTVGNERRLVLTKPGEILPGLRPPIVQPDWVARFGVALAVLRFDRQEGMSPSVRSIEARRLVEGLLARITSEGLPEPDLDAFGDQFSHAFDRWVVQLVDSLTGPSRT